MFLSDQSIIVARERYADLLRQAERERRLTTLQPPRTRQSSFIAHAQALWRLGVPDLRAIASDGPTTLAPCPD